MYKNYFFLNRFIVEINSILKDSLLLSAFSQEKDKLILEVKKDSEIKFLEISVNPGFPYINLKDSFYRAKKNTIDFFSEHLPLKLIQFEIASADRILRIKLETGFLYFTVRGKYTNISFQLENNKLENFKDPPDDFNEFEFLKEMDSTNFIEHLNIPHFKLQTDGDVWKGVRNKYPFIGKEIISETKTRLLNEKEDEIIKTFTEIIKEIFYSEPAVFIDRKSLQVYLAVSSFRIFPFTEKIFFDNIINGLNFFLNKKFYFEQLIEKRKRIQKHLDKELSHLTSKMNKLKGVLEKGSNEKENQKLGNLLLLNLSSIHKGMRSIEIQDIYETNKYITIKLDEILSPKKNVDNYFSKARNDRIKYEKSGQLFNNALKAYNNLKNIERKFNNVKDLEDYYIIMKELNIKEESSKSYKEDIQNKFKHYLIENRYNLFVGRDSKNNDLLTTKFAKQNDYWFHARGVPGSHAVLRVENTKESVPKNILKKAASIAAFHSKAKTAGTVPVSFTLKKYVVKKKGMEAGKVALLREDTLLVKPEIPDNCEYIEKD